MDLPHSLQTRLALGYFCIIAALLVLMNTYPMIMNQNLLFRSKQTTMANQAALVTNTLVTADELTSETVTQAIAQLEDLEVQRLVVTDEAGLVLYDTVSCDGCGQCLKSCPMGAISLDCDGKIQKCDGCIERQRAGKIPACVRVCPTGALYLGE